MFAAVVDAVAETDEGERILNRIEQAHGISSEHLGTTRRYGPLTAFSDQAAANAWFEAKAQKVDPDAVPAHVWFGAPGKNAPSATF